MNSYDVLGIGSPILDYIFYIDDSFLEQVTGKKGGWRLLIMIHCRN